MQQYRKKGTISVFLQVTEQNFEEAKKICPELRKDLSGVYDLEISLPNNRSCVNLFGSYLVKEEGGDWSLWNDSFLDDYEPVSAPSVPDSEVRYLFTKDELVRFATGFYFWWHNSPGTNTYQGFEEWFKNNIPATSQPFDLPHSEGGLRWVKAAERLPAKPGKYCIRWGGNYYTGDFSYPALGMKVPELGSYPNPNVFEWLDESASPSTANTAVSALQSILRNIDNGHWNCGEFREEIKSIAEQGLKTANLPNSTNYSSLRLNNNNQYGT